MQSRILVVIAFAASSACSSGIGPAPETAPASGSLPYEGMLRVTPDPVRVADTLEGCVRSSVLRFENTGSDSVLRIDRVETANDTLRVAGDFPLDISAGRSRFVDLHFVPAEAGDASGSIEIFTAESPLAAYRLEVIAVATERRDVRESLRPLDLVVVLDVSTTMGTLPRLRDAVRQLFDSVPAAGGDLRIGLTTFVNDVLVHGGGAFLDPAEFLRELDTQLDPDTGTPDFDLPRHQMNFDFPENSLAALYRSATEFPFRRDARRALLLITDDTFLEPPAVFSDGTPATASYAQVASALEEHGVRLVSIHVRARGRGLSSNVDGEPSLVSRTGGTWREFSDVTSSEQGLSGLLLDLAVGRSCD